MRLRRWVHYERWINERLLPVQHLDSESFHERYKDDATHVPRAGRVIRHSSKAIATTTATRLEFVKRECVCARERTNSDTRARLD